MTETRDAVDGDRLVQLLSALASPPRLHIVAALCEGREYVSELARRVGISRPLLHMHLRRLEAAGLVRGTLELSDDGKAMRYYEVTAFDVRLTPDAVASAAASLNQPADRDPPEGSSKEES